MQVHQRGWLGGSGVILPHGAISFGSQTVGFVIELIRGLRHRRIHMHIGTLLSSHDRAWVALSRPPLAYRSKNYEEGNFGRSKSPRQQKTLLPASSWRQTAQSVGLIRHLCATGAGMASD